MTIYYQSKPDAAIRAIEFGAPGEEQLTFFHVREKDAAEVSERLKNPALAQEILSTRTKDGETLIVSRGKKSSQEILKSFADRGETFELPISQKKKLNPWAWRGYTSIAGQSLQLASSFRTVDPKTGMRNASSGDNAAVLGFASLNLIANFINVFFGAQKKSDPHQLRYLKEQVNQQLAPYLEPGQELPSPDDNRLKQHPLPPKTSGQKFHDFVQKYSVSFGEIGLRTVGSLNLAFPFTQWLPALAQLRKGAPIGKIFQTARTKDSATFRVGLMMLIGKFTSFASKEADPYNPKPPSAIDKFREKVTFPLSSWIEGGAATYMGYDRWTHKKIKLGGDTLHRDYFGTAGNAIFVGGYGVRLFAKYGSLEVNMPELYTHITDGLAKVPRDKLPQLLAEASENLAEHFKDKHDPKRPDAFTLPGIYAGLAEMLERNHHIRVSSASPQPLAVAGTDMLPPAPTTRITAAQASHAETIVKNGHALAAS